MRVLVTYGSTRGGTEGLAHLVADDLRDEGVTVDLRPPSQVKNLGDDYDAVVVGGARDLVPVAPAGPPVRAAAHRRAPAAPDVLLFQRPAWMTRPAAPRSRPSGRSRP